MMKFTVNPWEQDRRVSESLRLFLGLAPGERIARIDVTQKIIAYIKDHNLESEDRLLIFPDDPLEKVVGTYEERKKSMEEIQNSDREIDRMKADRMTKITGDLTYFNLQFHLNKCFLDDEEDEENTEKSDIIESSITSTGAVTDNNRFSYLRSFLPSFLRK